MIPRNFHFIWVGDEPLPRWAEENICSWLRFHVGWEVYLWTDGSVPSHFPARDYYDEQSNPGAKADILRLAVLHQYGGLYLDVDVECWRRIDYWLDREALLVEESSATPETISNALMGFERGNPFLKFCLDRIVEDAEAHKERVSLSTGPGHVSRMHKVAGSELPIVRDHRVFFPFDWGHPRVVFPETIAVHQWRGSWRKRETKIQPC